MSFVSFANNNLLIIIIINFLIYFICFFNIPKLEKGWLRTVLKVILFIMILLGFIFSSVTLIPLLFGAILTNLVDIGRILLFPICLMIMLYEEYLIIKFDKNTITKQEMLFYVIFGLISAFFVLIFGIILPITISTWMQ